jgi:hypothetical protein
MHNVRIVSAEDSEHFIKFNPNNLIVAIDKAAHTKSTTISGMFIPIKHIVPTGTTSFKLQTPEVSCYLTDCDPENPGKQYKTSLLLDSTNKDTSFLEEDVLLQKATVDILQQFKQTCITQLTDRKQEFIEKFSEKKVTKKITPDTWNYMISSFEVVRPYVKTDNGRTDTSYYINPKVNNIKNFTTTFTYKGDIIPYEQAIDKFLGKKIYCVALISIDSLFFQATSNKLFVQTKIDDLIVTRFPSSAPEKALLPNRLQNIQNKDSDSESDTNDDEETRNETPFVES